MSTHTHVPGPWQGNAAKLGRWLARGILVTSMIGLSLPVEARERRGPSKSAAARAAGRGAPKPPAAKRQQEMLNLMESGSFPKEEVEAPNLVVAKIPPPTIGRRAATSARLRRVPARAAQRALRHARTMKPEAPPPPDVPETIIPPAPVEAKPAAPAPRSNPDYAKGATGKSIDALLAKAMEPTAPPPARRKPVKAVVSTTATELKPGQIAQVMKPVNAEVRSGCPFGERGIVTMRIEVGASGQVAEVTPEGPLSQRPATACVIAAVKQAKIPAAAGVSFRYPFAVR